MPGTKLYTSLAAIGIVLVIFSGCSADTAAPDDVMLTEQLEITPLPSAVAQATTPTVTASPAATESGPTRLSVWWPAPLAPLDNSDAVDILSEQISGFQVAQGNMVVELRWKNEMDPGGILSTLRTASPVAPGALPDLTLLRRADLIAAAQAGLIYPLDGRISSAVTGDLYAIALELGNVGGQLYGLPYALETQHIAYRPGNDEEPAAPASWRYNDILQSGFSFVFPAAQVTDINSLIYTEYLAAGGTQPASGAVSINEEALLSTLQFYEDALTQGLIDPDVLNFTASTDYINDLIEGNIQAGLIGSTQYLELVQAGVPLDYGPIPTESGVLISEVDGWIWVLTTPNADRQALAIRFLNWMLNANRQGEYNRTVNMLPSQRTALQQSGDEDYMAFSRQLLTNGILPQSDTEGGAFARAVQTALIAVLSGQNTAAEATQILIDQIDG